ncbi:MAG TPA: inorganic pyrophosphatase [Candidatus Andersenbacteria bacterium]|nr:inorganic pyrophosphatase [Candidatus Andersenbacteria bacterium]
MGGNESKSLEIARQFLGKEVEIIFDRPFGSRHPVFGFIYEVNYGYVKGVKSPDGENLDVYFLGSNEPLEKGYGIVKAIIHRFDDDDDKLVVMPKDLEISDEEIEKAVHFQEKYFKHEIILCI